MGPGFQVHNNDSDMSSLASICTPTLGTANPCGSAEGLHFYGQAYSMSLVLHLKALLWLSEEVYAHPRSCEDEIVPVDDTAYLSA